MTRWTLPIALTALLAGCAQPAMPLRPRFPHGGQTTAMAVSDTRTPQPSFYRTNFGDVIDASRSCAPHPKQSQVIGNMANVVLYLDAPRTVADAIAMIVATKFPSAKMTLRDCRSVAEAGVWMNGFTVHISVDVEQNGKTITLNASGKNTWARITAENYEKAYEAALEELARQVEMAPPL